MDTNQNDKEGSGYLGEQRNATSLVGPWTLKLIKFWGKWGKQCGNKWKSVGNVLATAFWSAPAAAT